MINNLYQLYLKSPGVSTDTRKINPGSIFFALKGPKFDANAFAGEAIQKGAAYAVIDNRQYQKDERYIVVPDTLQALQKLANHHRNKMLIPFLAITGSNGKTTTKELISAVLRKKYKTAFTQGNLNNHIGVPLTILSIAPDTQIAIIEMGANKIGDITELCRIAEPTHGLITNIGSAHIEGFGSYEGVIRGKSELYQWLIQNEGLAFINSQNPVLSNMAKRFKEPVYYPAKGDYLYAEFVKADPYVIYKDEKGVEVRTRLVGSYNFENIAAALCIAKYFDVSSELTSQAIQEYTPSNNRSQVYRTEKNTILLDAYNANPSSMKAAIENLASMEAPHKIAVVGDMFELGAVTESEHRKIGELLKAKKFNQALLCGIAMRWAKEAYPEAQYFENKDELKKFLASQKFQNSLILVKASRGMALEELLEAIE